jgi:hypothetical protein
MAVSRGALRGVRQALTYYEWDSLADRFPYGSLSRLRLQVIPLLPG